MTSKRTFNEKRSVTKSNPNARYSIQQSINGSPSGLIMEDNIFIEGQEEEEEVSEKLSVEQLKSKLRY